MQTALLANYRNCCYAMVATLLQGVILHYRLLQRCVCVQRLCREVLTFLFCAVLTFPHCALCAQWAVQSSAKWAQKIKKLGEATRNFSGICFSVMFILWAHLNRASKTFLVTALTTTSPLCHHNLWAVVEVVIKILLRLVEWIVFLFNSLFNFVTKWRYINFSFDACLLFASETLLCVLMYFVFCILSLHWQHLFYCFFYSHCTIWSHIFLLLL